MKLSDLPKYEPVKSKQELTDLLNLLAHQIKNNPKEYPNSNLIAFLEAMAAWINSSDGFYNNQGVPIPPLVCLSSIRDAVEAGLVYS
jgi:hypothetical protein